jgi:hypothetical protein
MHVPNSYREIGERESQEFFDLASSDKNVSVTSSGVIHKHLKTNDMYYYYYNSITNGSVTTSSVNSKTT